MGEHESLQQQLAGIQIPGISFPAPTGIASTRSGMPGSSHSHAQDEIHSARQAHANSYAGAPSFAASAAGVAADAVRPRVTRGVSNSKQSSKKQGGGSGTRFGDEAVYSYQSDRFIPASQFPGQAQSSEVVALKNTPGVDIFAIPPADHIQRLPEQLAHTLKYMVSQLDQITRALNVYDFRAGLLEQKVQRLDQQQARWTMQDFHDDNRP
jgi:hypothetical protein